MVDTNTMTHNSNGQFDMFKLVMGGFMTLITASIMWVAMTLVDTQVAIAEINRDVLNVSLDIAEMREADQRLAESRYTSDQAAADFRLQAATDMRQDADLRRFKERTEQLALRLDAVENQ